MSILLCYYGWENRSLTCNILIWWLCLEHDHHPIQPCLLEVMLCCLGYLHRQLFFIIGKATTCTPNCKSNGGGSGGWWVCKGQGFDTGDQRTNRIHRRRCFWLTDDSWPHLSIYPQWCSNGKTTWRSKEKSARLTIMCWKLEIAYDPETASIVGRHQLVKF